MPYAQVDDRLHSHPKVLRAWNENRTALGLHLLALSHAAAHSTDGRIERFFVDQTLPKATERGRAVRTLVGAGLWDELGDGAWQIHDFLHRNISRAADARRRALQGKRSLKTLVRQRDRQACRYCGVPVMFDGPDRRSSRAGVYSFVDPFGQALLENVVVSCRDCEKNKGDLTPEEAGMALLPEPAQMSLGAAR